jgi:nitrate reductase gamma subunit
MIAAPHPVTHMMLASLDLMMMGVPLIYKLHVLLGFTIFLISPFTRMIHVTPPL